jgi:hypothetical protein
MDDRLHAALAAIDPAAAAHCAARWPRMDAAERGAVEHLVREHSDAARRVRVAVWADRIRGGER